LKSELSKQSHPLKKDRLTANRGSKQIIKSKPRLHDLESTRLSGSNISSGNDSINALFMAMTFFDMRTSRFRSLAADGLSQPALDRLAIWRRKGTLPLACFGNKRAGARLPGLAILVQTHSHLPK